MKRWHQEQDKMLKRWKIEMGLHGYDWRNPPTDPNACHCVTGVGFFRKTGDPRGCGCCWCKFEKTFRQRSTKRSRAIMFEIKSWE